MNKKVDNKFYLKNKKGQFYLVAAIIIVMIISGIASVKTYAVITSEPKNIQEISRELKEESPRIVDYGIYNDKEIKNIIENFDSNFSEYFLKKTENANIVFIYGNRTELYSLQYNNFSTGSVFATVGGSAPTWGSESTIANITDITPSGNSVNVSILNRNFSFNITNNEMFYFVITQEKEGEIIIERN